MILAPFAGAMVDRLNRKKVMLIADSLIALITLFLAVLFIFDLVEIWHIYVLMFMRSIGGSFHYTAMSASTSLMVPKEKFTKIQGLNQVLHSILTIIAAPLGALALEVLEVGHVLFIDVATASVAILPLIFVAIPQPDVTTTEEEKSNPIRTLFRDVADGFRYIYHWKGLFYLILLATLLNALINPAFSLLPLLVNKTFGLGAPELATLETALGIGMLCGSLLLSVWGGFRKKIITSTLGLFLNSIGIFLLALAPSSQFWMVIAGIAFFGLTNPIVNGPINALFQETVDPKMQGRVFALIGTLASAISPVGLMIAGPLADRFGVQAWFLVGGIYILIMVGIILASPVIMAIDQGSNHQSALTASPAATVPEN
jgi:DHA3 family macrolide efflux protein-like MFS transporter